MQLFDSHCHFDFAVFDNDRDLIWRKCDVLGITHLIIPGVAPEQWPTAIGIAQQYRNISLGVGLHPWWINEESVKKEGLKRESLKKDIAENDIEHFLKSLRLQLQKNIRQQKCVAIGECGLDAVVETPIALQQQVLDIHLQLAQQVSMPLIIHCRNMHNELLQQLKSYNLTGGGVIHGFSGSYELAASYWDMGFRLGIGGTITYERASKTRAAVKKLPLDAILLETDAPDMPLSGKQGERNSPTHIIEIAQMLADLRGEPLEKIAAQTTLNSRTLFKIEH
jgi:TatD DNase family protein